MRPGEVLVVYTMFDGTERAEWLAPEAATWRVLAHPDNGHVIYSAHVWWGDIPASAWPMGYDLELAANTCPTNGASAGG